MIQVNGELFPMLVVTLDDAQVQRADYDRTPVPDGAVVQVIHLLSGG
jgi:hypothetical protein